MKKILIVLACLALVPFAACGLLSMSTCGVMGLRAAARASAQAAPTALPVIEPEPAANAPSVAAEEPVTASIANFTKDTLLDECDDFAITAPRGADMDAGKLQGMVESLVKGMVKGKKGMSRLSKPCTEQFRTIPVLATCTLSTPFGKDDAGADRGGRMEIVGRYYNLDMITKSDTYMKNCIDSAGDWQAADKNSDEYREAVRARARREIEKAQKMLGQ